MGYDVGILPDGAVGKFELLDPVIGNLVVARTEHVLDRQPVGGADDADDEIRRANADEGDIAGGNACGEADLVDCRRVGGLDLDDRVLPVAAREVIGIRAVAAFEQVVAQPAGQDIGAASALDVVVARTAVDVCADGRAGNVGGDDDVIVASRRGNACGQRMECDRAAIGKRNRGDHRIGIARRIDQRDPVVATGDRQNDVAIGIASCRNIFKRDPCRERQRAEPVRLAVAFDPVVPVAARKTIDIGPAAADQDIVAGPADEGFGRSGPRQAIILPGADRANQRAQLGKRKRGTVAKRDRIDTRPVRGVAQDQHVAAVGKRKHQFVARWVGLGDLQFIGAIAADRQPVGARSIVDHVVAIAARESVGIVTRAAADLVVAGPACQGIGAGAADDDVVARAALGHDRSLDQNCCRPHGAIGEFDIGHAARTQRALDEQFVARAGEGDYQIGGIERSQTHNRVVHRMAAQHDRRRSYPIGHFDAVYAFARVDHDPIAIGEDYAVMSGAGIQRAVGRQVAQINPVLAFVGQAIADDPAHLCNRQAAAVGKDEAFDRPGAVTAANHQTIGAVAQSDQQIAVDVAEVDQIPRDRRAEHDPVDPAGVVNAVAAVAEAELVRVVAQPALERVRSGSARERVRAVVYADQVIVSCAAGQHPVDHCFDRPHRAVGKFELLDFGGRKAADDGQNVEPIAQIDQQVVAIAADHQVCGAHRSAEDHPVDDIGSVCPLEDFVEPIACGEGISIGAVAAVQQIVALAPVEHVGLIEQPGDDIVTAIAPGDLEQLFDIGDADRRAIVELEQFDPVLGVAELVADAQSVAASDDRDQQVIAVLGEDDLVAGDAAAQLDNIVDRNTNTGAVAPPGPYPAIDDHVLAIASIELVGIAAVTTDQGIVAAATVDGFGKIGPSDGIVARAADQVDVLGIDVRERHCAIGEHQRLDREGLRAIAHILVFKDELLPGGAHRDHQVERGPAKIDIQGRNPGEDDLLVARIVEDRVVALARRNEIGVVPAEADQAIVTGAAVKRIRKRLEPVNRIVSSSLGDIDIVLRQLVDGPFGTVAEDDVFDQIDQPDDRDFLEQIDQDNL